MKKGIRILVLVVIAGLIGQAAKANNDFKVSYGYLSAPLFHDLPGSENIQIAYAKIENPVSSGRTPIFYLSGGPGGGAVRLAERYKKNGFLPPMLKVALRNGPLYLIDQRGSGNSEPELRCNASKILANFGGGYYQDYLEQTKKIVEYCKVKFHNFKSTMKALSSIESANDLELLRQEIKAESIVLFGESYGTHLSFSYMRYYSSKVEKAALSLIEGPDHTFKLPKQFDEAVLRIDEFRGHRRQSAIYPLIIDLIADFENDGKISFDVHNPGTQSTELATLSLFEFRLYVRFHSNKRDQAALYRVLYKREYLKIKQWVVNWFRRGRFNGMFFAMDCASNASKGRMQKIAEQNNDSLLAEAMNFPFPNICDYLGLAPLPDKFRTPLKSDVPSIFFSGILDYKTPVSNAKEVAENFTQVLLVNDPDGFHNYCDDPNCLDQLDSFLSQN